MYSIYNILTKKNHQIVKMTLVG